MNTKQLVNKIHALEAEKEAILAESQSKIDTLYDELEKQHHVFQSRGNVINSLMEQRDYIQSTLLAMHSQVIEKYGVNRYREGACAQRQMAVGCEPKSETPCSK